jgi:hypothetical protein
MAFINNGKRMMMGGDSMSYEQAIKISQYGPSMWETSGRTSLQFSLTEAPGILSKAINILT